MRAKEIERKFKFVEPLTEGDFEDHFKKACQEVGVFFVREEVEI
jgi:hypothetical protein